MLVNHDGAQVWAKLRKKLCSAKGKSCHFTKAHCL